MKGGAMATVVRVVSHEEEESVIMKELQLQEDL
jgi:hypothetical protein